MCTAGMEAADTAEWLGELGSDLQGPMASCSARPLPSGPPAGDSRVNDHDPLGRWGLGADVRPQPAWLPAALGAAKATVLEDALHAEPVGGTRLQVSLQVCGQLAARLSSHDPRGSRY